MKIILFIMIGCLSSCNEEKTNNFEIFRCELNSKVGLTLQFKGQKNKRKVVIDSKIETLFFYGTSLKEGKFATSIKANDTFIINSNNEFIFRRMSRNKDKIFGTVSDTCKVKIKKHLKSQLIGI